DPFSFGLSRGFVGFCVGGRCEAASGGEALSEVVEAQELVGAHGIGGWGVGRWGCRELARGVAGGEGEVEVGLVADGGHDGLQSGAEGGATEPSAEDGGGGPEVGGWAVLGAEGTEKSGLLVGGS